jgi:Tfp pilus assembly protein PilN
MRINLVPEVQEQKIQGQKINSIATISATVIIVITVLTIIIINVIMISEKAILAGVQNRIEAVQEESQKHRELEESVISLDKGLKEAKKIILGENSWTQLFPHLEAATPSGIRFTKLQVSAGQIEAELATNNVDELSKFVDSYKNYRVLAVSGQSAPGEVVTLTVSGQESQARANLAGGWTLSLRVSEQEDFEAVVQVGSKEFARAKYSSSSKKFEGGENINPQIKNLFKAVAVEGYTKDKESGSVAFTAKMNYEGGILW